MQRGKRKELVFSIVPETDHSRLGCSNTDVEKWMD